MATNNLPKTDSRIRPQDISDGTVSGVGKLTEALEKIERARGSLYDFHQMIGSADITIAEAIDELEKAGNTKQAAMLREKIVGLNVLEGRWTFQIVEEFDDGYYSSVKHAEAQVRDELLAGKRHVFESEMKEANRTKGLPGHEARP